MSINLPSVEQLLKDLRIVSTWSSTDYFSPVWSEKNGYGLFFNAKECPLNFYKGFSDKAQLTTYLEQFITCQRHHANLQKNVLPYLYLGFSSLVINTTDSVANPEEKLKHLIQICSDESVADLKLDIVGNTGLFICALANTFEYLEKILKEKNIDIGDLETLIKFLMNSYNRITQQFPPDRQKLRKLYPVGSVDVEAFKVLFHKLESFNKVAKGSALSHDTKKELRGIQQTLLEHLPYLCLEQVKVLNKESLPKFLQDNPTWLIFLKSKNPQCSLADLLKMCDDIDKKLQAPILSYEEVFFIAHLLPKLFSTATKSSQSLRVTKVGNIPENLEQLNKILLTIEEKFIQHPFQLAKQDQLLRCRFIAKRESVKEIIQKNKIVFETTVDLKIHEIGAKKKKIEKQSPEDPLPSFAEAYENLHKAFSTVKDSIKIFSEDNKNVVEKYFLNFIQQYESYAGRILILHIDALYLTMSEYPDIINTLDEIIEQVDMNAPPIAEEMTDFYHVIIKYKDTDYSQESLPALPELVNKLLVLNRESQNSFKLAEEKDMIHTLQQHIENLKMLKEILKNSRKEFLDFTESFGELYTKMVFLTETNEHHRTSHAVRLIAQDNIISTKVFYQKCQETEDNDFHDLQTELLYLEKELGITINIASYMNNPTLCPLKFYEALMRSVEGSSSQVQEYACVMELANAASQISLPEANAPREGDEALEDAVRKQIKNLKFLKTFKDTENFLYFNMSFGELYTQFVSASKKQMPKDKWLNSVTDETPIDKQYLFTRGHENEGIRDGFIDIFHLEKELHISREASYLNQPNLSPLKFYHYLKKEYELANETLLGFPPSYGNWLRENLPSFLTEYPGIFAFLHKELGIEIISTENKERESKPTHPLPWDASFVANCGTNPQVAESQKKQQSGPYVPPFRRQTPH